MRFSLIILILSVVAGMIRGAEGVVREGSYTTIDGSTTLQIPADLIKDNGIRDMSDGQGITCQMVFLREKQKVSGVVSTKIRAEFPKTDVILFRTAARYRQNIKAEDGSTMEYLDMVDVAERKMLLSVVRHIEEGNATVLKDTWQGTQLAIRGDVLEARMYFVQNGYFVEFKNMVMPTLALHMSEPENEIAAQAMIELRMAVIGSNILTEEQKKALEKLDLQRPYIRGIFKDPSLVDAAEKGPGKRP